MSAPARVLIVEARFYNEIADALVDGATTPLDAAGVAYDRIAVPGVFEIPAALNFAIKASSSDTPTPQYAGFIALGCVIRGETDHYDHICREASRAMMELTVDHAVAFGFGLLTCENKEQAWARAKKDQKDVGGNAGRACLRMMEIQKDLHLVP